MAASLFAILLFFVYTWGLGFSLGRLVRESGQFFERNLMRLGIGFCAFVVLGIVLNAVRVPLDWRVFLAASLACPLYCLFFRQGYRQLKAPSLKLRLSDVNVLLLLVIFSGTAYMYISGAFSYDYLEDDDPWSHVRGIKFISVEKTGFANAHLNSQYIDPYPPSYDMFFGVLDQASSSVYWVVKFFNALVISLSVIFFYFFAKEFMGGRNKALFAAFVLASVPAYMSHFIWAPAFAMVAFFPAMYAFEMARHDKRWWIVAGVCFGSILLIHPTHAAKLSVMLAIYLGVRILSGFFADRKSWLQASLGGLKAVALGVLLSLFWWGFKWRVFARTSTAGFKGGPEAASQAIEKAPNVFAKFLSLVTRALNPDSGTATRVYTFRDFFIAQSQNMINNPVGLGVVVCLLMAAGLFSAVFALARYCPRPRLHLPLMAVFIVVFSIFVASNTLEFQEKFHESDKNDRPQNWVNLPSYWPVFALSLVLGSLLAAFLLSLLAVYSYSKKGDAAHVVYLSILLGWLLFAFLGVNNKTFNLPVGLFAFRFWMILAVPAAMLASEGLFALLAFVERFRLSAAAATAAKLALIIIVVAGVFFTSAKAKYDVNTSAWYPGAFWTVIGDGQGRVVAHEVQDYLWLKTLPDETRVFTFSNPDQVLGFDKYSCGWCEPEAGMKKRFSAGNVSAQELHAFMKEHSYEYFIIGGLEAKNYGENITNVMLNGVANSGLFEVAYQGRLAFVFRAS